MKKLTYFAASLLFALSLTAMFSCGNDSKVMKLMEERDSLKALSENQSKELMVWGQMMDTLSNVLDSISAGEGMIFKSNGDVPLKRKDVLENLKRFEEIVSMQREKIDALEKELKERGMDAKAAKLIANLKAQIEEKDREIAELKEELSRKDVDIQSLNQKVTHQANKLVDQATEIEDLSNINKMQEEGLKAQDKLLNQCYVLIASKKQLKKMGINKLKNLAANQSQFMCVDMRVWKEVTINAKKATILTDMPQSSYSLTQAGKNIYTLRINDVAAFWSSTKYLIIQTD